MHSLPDGRRFARIDGPGEVFVLVREGVVMDAAANEELQEVMQESIDCGLYGQNWGAAEAPPHPLYFG